MPQLLEQSAFAAIPFAPLHDQIVAVTEAFRKDPRKEKINLSIGVYRDEQGILPVFESVKQAEAMIAEQERSSGTGKAYSPIEGLPEFREASSKLIFGNVSREHIVTVQTIGGSGALTLTAILAREFLAPEKVYFSDPCWVNHPGIFKLQKVKTAKLPYYDAERCKLLFDDFCSSLERLSSGSIVLLQASCHNPSGVDLSKQQWRTLSDLFKENQLIPILDLAYQGLAESLEDDAYAARLFANEGIPGFVAHSFSKSMSLYGERTGSLSIVTESAEQAQAVMSQLKNIIRPLYSNAPIHGAKIAATVLNDSTLSSQWQNEVGQLRTRINGLRRLLAAELKKNGVTDDLRYIAEGHGMFALLKLTPQQVAQLAEKHALYLVPDGRICIPALTMENVERVAKAIGNIDR